MAVRQDTRWHVILSSCLGCCSDHAAAAKAQSKITGEWLVEIAEVSPYINQRVLAMGCSNSAKQAYLQLNQHLLHFWHRARAMAASRFLAPL